MPTIPESPRRSSNTASAGGNPVKNDPKLMVLMERLDLVDSHTEFVNWKADFLERFEFFLGEEGSEEALKAYENFRQSRMEKVVKKVDRLSDYREKGDLSVERVSVRARNAMNEVSVTLLDTVKEVRGLVPPTSADEDRAGYTKYHLGAVLVSDGFQEYERLEKCRQIMDKMRDECVQQIGDEKLLDAIRKYDDEVSRFVSIMEDLGLYKIMLKERAFDPTQRDKPTRESEPQEIATEEPAPNATPLLPELPFTEDDVDVEDENHDVDVEAENPEVGDSVVEEAQPEMPPETPETEEKRRRSSRKEYDVKGSWGGMPMEFGDSSSSSLKVKQDLASSPRKKTVGSPRKKQPDQVFVTPARRPKKPAPINTDDENSEDENLHSPPNLVTEGIIGDDSTSSVADGSVVESVGGKTFAPETSRVLETDTPRTKKKKLEWLSVKTSRGKTSAIPSKEGKTKTKKDKMKSPKPPRPSATKELVTKTQDKGWSMPMDEDADASSVWSRSGPPTPIGSKSKLSISSDVPIGPGIKVRRVSISRTDPEPREKDAAKANGDDSTEAVGNAETEENSNVALSLSAEQVPHDIRTEETTNETVEEPEVSHHVEETTNETVEEPEVSHHLEETTNETVEEPGVSHHVEQKSVSQSTSQDGTVTTITSQLDNGDVATHHHDTTTTVHHHNDIEEKHVFETVHRTVKTTYETDHVGHEVINSGRFVHGVRRGIDWIGTVPKVEVTEVHRDTGYYVTGKVRRATYIRMLTFCGIDDTIDPRLLGIVSHCYPLVEFAVLMRQEMAGQPRYASAEYLQRLTRVQAKSEGKMNLAAHLCGAFVDEILNGNDEILGRLTEMQFRRVQLNATSAYGVNTLNIGKFVDSIINIGKRHSDLEISIQANDENRALWHGVLNAGEVPKNVTLLFDSSMGRGEVPEVWPTAPTGYRVGYAGGIGLGGKNMTKRMLSEILSVGNGQAIWVSMESSLRSTKNGKDVFDLEKCYEVIDAAHECKIHLHPTFVH